jgi:hypothetical protein
MKKLILLLNLGAAMTLISCTDSSTSSTKASNSSASSSSHTTSSTSSSSSSSAQPVIKFTITFKNYDGKVLQSSKYQQGYLPAYQGSVPSKPADVQYTYTFDGWDKPIVYAVADATYTAVYSNKVNQYNVTFKNDDGTLLQSTSWDYGSTPSYSGETPTKKGDARYTSYSFIGWDKDIAPVDGSAVYVASYRGNDLKAYTINFLNYDGALLQTSKFDYGTTPTYNGVTPLRAPDAQYTSYTFKGWSPTLSLVTGEATYTAQFSTGDLKQYTITFKNYDGTILEQKQWDYGAYPIYSGSTPTKPAEKLCTHPFAGWSPSLGFVKADTTYTAYFDNVSVGKIERGKYPQTLVEDATTLTGLADAKDSDNDGLLEYGNEEYYKLASASVSANASSPITSESGKTTFVNGTSYYFKVEPIEWNVLDGTNGLLMTKKILFRSDYYTASSILATRTIDSAKIENNNYKYSSLRAKLNGLDFSAYVDSNKTAGVNFSGNLPGIFSEAGGFLNNAFSAQEQQEIVTTEVDNSAASTINPNNTYACANTNDKVFALSYQDLSNANYGFSNSKSLKAVVTDYARATGVWAASSTYWSGEGDYWSRSPEAGEYYAHIVSYVDFFGTLSEVGSDHKDSGVRPAIKITLD